MGGLPDQKQKSSSFMGGAPDPCENSSSRIDQEFHKNFHSSKIKLDLEAFEDHVLNEGYNLRDDPSCSSESHASKPTDSSCSSESHSFEHNDLSSYGRIDGIIASASKDLDRLTDEIFCLDSKE